MRVVAGEGAGGGVAAQGRVATSKVAVRRGGGSDGRLVRASLFVWERGANRG